jgi:hypothetical protein
MGVSWNFVGEPVVPAHDPDRRTEYSGAADVHGKFAVRAVIARERTAVVLTAHGSRPALANAVARRLGIPDLTTTVLTLTLTGLAADSAPAGGEAPRPGRRILSVPAMCLGAVAGAELVLHGHLLITLALTCSSWPSPP